MAFHCLPDEIRTLHTYLCQRGNEPLLGAQPVVTTASTTIPLKATIFHPSAQENAYSLHLPPHVASLQQY